MAHSFHYGIDCRIIIQINPFLPGHQQHDIKIEPARDQNKIPWCAVVTLDVRMPELLQFYEHGLFWTTDNILLPAEANPTNNQQDRETLLRASLKQSVASIEDIFGPLGFQSPWNSEEVRSWRMREHPDKPAEESRWTGRIHLCAQDGTSKTMAEFDFNQLTRRRIYAASIMSYLGDQWFRYLSWNPAANKNYLPGKSGTDIWWLWPMESVVAPPAPPPVGKGQDSSGSAQTLTLRRRVPEPGIHARRDDGSRGVGGRGQIEKPDCCGCRCAHHTGKGSSRVQESYSDIFKEICKNNGDFLAMGMLIILLVACMGFLVWLIDTLANH